MKFNPKAIAVREAIAGAVFDLLLVAGLCLLVVGLKHGTWVLALAGFLIEAGHLGVQCLTGGRTWIERLIASLSGGIGSWRYRRAESKYRQRQEWEAAAGRLACLEKRVNELAEMRLNQRVAALEQAEAWRSQQEWSQIRDVWGLLILDPKTPEELRESCREWLARYPEALDFLTQRLEQMGLLKGNDLLLDENWEGRERHKWRVQ